MRHLSILLFLMAGSCGYGQINDYSMYSTNGALRADTSLKITSAQLERWCRIERQLIAHLFKEVEYSEMALDASAEGTSICSFNVTPEGLLENFQVLSLIGWGLEPRIEKGLKSFALLTSLKDSLPVRYYLSIDFQIIDAYEHLKERGFIPIIGNTVKLIQH